MRVRGKGAALSLTRFTNFIEVKNKKLVVKNSNTKQVSLLVLLLIMVFPVNPKIVLETAARWWSETVLSGDHISSRHVWYAPVLSVDRNGQWIGVFVPSHWRGITVSADTASDLIMDCRSSGGGHFRVTSDPPLLRRGHPP